MFFTPHTPTNLCCSPGNIQGRTLTEKTNKFFPPDGVTLKSLTCSHTQTDEQLTDLCTLHAYHYSEPADHGGWLTNKLSSATNLWIPEAQTTVTSLPYIQLNLDRLNSKRIQLCILNNIFPGKKQPKIESRSAELHNWEMRLSAGD